MTGRGHGPFPLSFEQEGLLFEESIGEEAGTHSVLNVTRLPEHDPLRLGAAWRSVVRRHGALRSSIDVAGGLQTVEERDLPELPVVDLSGLTGDAAAQAMALLVRDHQDAPVTRGDACPVRVTGVAHPTFGPVLVQAFDHLLADCASAAVVESELLMALTGAGGPPPDVEADAYGRYAAQQRERASSAGWVEQEVAYWERALADVRPVTNLVAPPGENGDRVDFRDVRWQPTKGGPHHLLALAKAARSTPGPVLLALTAATVAALAGEEGETTVPLLVGFTSRRRPELGALVGCMFNNRLVPIATDGGDTVLGNVARAKKAVIGALQHSRTSQAVLAGALPRLAAWQQGAGACLVDVGFTTVRDARWLSYGPGAPRHAADESGWSTGYRDLVQTPGRPGGINHLLVRVHASRHGALIETRLRGAERAAGVVQRITDGIVALGTAALEGDRSVRSVLAAGDGWS